MLHLMLVVALVKSDPAWAISPLLTRLSLRTCDAALSSTSESLLRSWFSTRAGYLYDDPGDVYPAIHGFRDEDPEAINRRAFKIDETLERLGEQSEGPPARGRLDAERWQLELSAQVGDADLPRGFSLTVLGDRLRFDLTAKHLVRGEFVMGIHWESPANKALVSSLASLIAQVHRRRREFRGVPLRVLQSGEVARGELYVLLDAAGESPERFDLTLEFFHAVTEELKVWSGHFDARSG